MSRHGHTRAIGTPSAMLPEHRQLDVGLRWYMRVGVRVDMRVGMHIGVWVRASV